MSSHPLTPAWRDWPQTVQLVKAFADAKAELRFVGGGVRDALLGRPVQDVDVATRLAPEAVMALLEAADIKAVPTGLAHGTITAVLPDKSFEITTLRRDVSTDGRHAEIEFTDDWQEDAARRDFTMNALYLSPEGELFDYFAGAEDAKAGKVRFIGDAPERIREDRLRILRFFRFYAHYGKGAPDAAALAACEHQAEGLAELSGERIWQELSKLLAAGTYDKVIELMQERGVLAPALGFAVADTAIFAGLKKAEKNSGVRLNAVAKAACFVVSSGSPQALAERLRLSNRDAARIRILVETAAQLTGNVDEAAQKRILRHVGKEDFIAAVMIAQAADASSPAYTAMLKLAQSWQVPVFPVKGADLLKRGMKEGTALGEALKKLEEAWEASDYALSREELLARLTS